MKHRLFDPGRAPDGCQDDCQHARSGVRVVLMIPVPSLSHDFRRMGSSTTSFGVRQDFTTVLRSVPVTELGASRTLVGGDACMGGLEGPIFLCRTQALCF